MIIAQNASAALLLFAPTPLLLKINICGIIKHMANVHSLDFAAHQPTTVEHEGDILPSYGANTPNGPIYPDASKRDKEIPHDKYESGNRFWPDQTQRHIGSTAIKDIRDQYGL
jgi:hypothetical protein